MQHQRLFSCTISLLLPALQRSVQRKSCSCNYCSSSSSMTAALNEHNLDREQKECNSKGNKSTNSIKARWLKKTRGIFGLKKPQNEGAKGRPFRGRPTKTTGRCAVASFSCPCEELRIKKKSQAPNASPHALHASRKCMCAPKQARGTHGEGAR